MRGGRGYCGGSDVSLKHVLVLDHLRVLTERLDFTHGLLLVRGCSCTDEKVEVGLRLSAIASQRIQSNASSMDGADDVAPKK